MERHFKKINKETIKKGISAYDRLDPGNTIITRKKFINRFLITRMVISLVTAILFIYAIYTAYKDSNDGWSYWFWLFGYIAISLMYVVYTYDKFTDIINYREVKEGDYFQNIDNDEHMFIYGNIIGKLSDFSVRKELDHYK